MVRIENESDRNFVRNLVNISTAESLESRRGSSDSASASIESVLNILRIRKYKLFFRKQISNN